jgi:hypothetical protein
MVDLAREGGIEEVPMVDFVIGLLQGLAFAFVVFGAYLAVSRAEVRLRMGDPPLASAESEKRIALEERLEPRPERRQRTRRQADRPSGPEEGFYGLPR